MTVRFNRIACLLLALCLAWPAGALAASPLEWYQRMTGGTEGSVTAPAPQPAGGEAVVYRAQKLVSTVFGGLAVGHTVVPDGWNVQLRELTLGSESIAWPNALYVTVTSPDGECVLKYQSKRMYSEVSASVSGLTTHSTDDAIDRSTMMHTLNYRDAAGVCDLRVGILFDDSFTFTEERALTAEEQSGIQAAREQYFQSAEEANQLALQISGGNTTWQWSDLTMAERTYCSGSRMALVTAISDGVDLLTDLGMGATIERVFWSVEGLCAMSCPAQSFERYRDVYEVFAANTGASQEYTAMTERHAEHLQLYYMQLQNGGPTTGEEELSAALDEVTADTVGTGDTYSIMDGWSDVIRDETDYTTSDGSRVKLPSVYDHVFEGDDGTLYAGYSVDGPTGSVELYPTQIGN